MCSTKTHDKRPETPAFSAIGLLVDVVVRIVVEVVEGVVGDLVPFLV